MQQVAADEAFQFDLAGRTEGQITSRLHDLTHQRRHEDLTTVGLVGDPCRQHHRLAEQVAVLLDRLTGVHPDPHPQRIVRPGPSVHLQRPHDLHRAQDRRPRTRERQHEPVTLRLHLVPARPFHLTTNEPVVEAQQLHPRLVTQLLRPPRRTLDVGEHDRQRATARLHHRRRSAPAAAATMSIDVRRTSSMPGSASSTGDTTSSRHEPNVADCPGSSGVGCRTGTPSIRVPFVLPRSSTVTRPATELKRRCRRDNIASVNSTPSQSRPISNGR